VPISVVVGFNPKAVQGPHENQIEFSVGQQGAGTHAVAHAVGEHWCVGLLQPPLWSELFRVGPHIWIYIVTVSVLEESQMVRIKLPMLQAQAFKKNTVPLGITIP
jgi:hypothetical protein